MHTYMYTLHIKHTFIHTFSHTYMYIHIHVCTHIYIYGTVSNKFAPQKRLNHYNFQTVKAIDFLFSTLHTTPFLYGEIRFGGIAMCDIPLGSNPPNTFWFSCNQIAFKIRFVGREVPVPIAANCVPLYQAGKCACRPLYLQTEFEAI